MFFKYVAISFQVFVIISAQNITKELSKKFVNATDVAKANVSLTNEKNESKINFQNENILKETQQLETKSVVYISNKEGVLNSEEDDVSSSQKEWSKLISELANVTFQDDSCKTQVIAYVNAIPKLEMWALQMMDATSKLQAGILNGNIVDLGDFNECLKVNFKSQDFGIIKGQHCTVFADVDYTDLLSRVLLLPNTLPTKDFVLPVDMSLNPKIDVDHSRHLPEVQRLSLNLDNLISRANERVMDIPILPLGFGVCLPASCSVDDVYSVVNFFLKNVNITSKKTQNSELFCSSDKVDSFSTIDWICTFVFLLFATLMISSTAYDVHNQFLCKEKCIPNPLYIAFSAWTNGNKLFTVTPATKIAGDTLHNVTGIRALSVIWVVFLHRIYRNVYVIPIRNNSTYADFVKSYFSSIYYGSTLSVDTFLVISGLLITYNFFKPVKTVEKFNIPKFYLHRYLRLTPPLAAFLLFKASLMNYLGRGPYWKYFMNPTFCREYWWSLLLYIENYINPLKMCNVTTWSLSVDMQLFIISPIILILLKKSSKLCISLITMSIFGSLGIIYGLVYVNDLPTTCLVMDGDTSKQWTATYVPTHGRYGPWLAGILLGYFMRQPDVKMSKATISLGWLLALSAIFGVVFGAYPYAQFVREVTEMEGIVYQVVNRIAWAAGVCWVIYACHKGYGGPINWFLSLTLWQPVSKLSYCIYIIHFPVQLAMTASLKQYMSFDVFQCIHSFWGDFGIVTCLAVIWTLAFEMPVFALERIMWQKPTKQPAVANGVEIVEKHEKRTNLNEVTTF